jgi:hypothetical protein
VNPRRTAGNVAELFFPQSKSLGIDRSGYSPTLQAKIVYAGANNTSYEQGAADLVHLADLPIKAPFVRRLCKEIGGQRCQQRDEAAAQFQTLPLVRRKQTPEGVEAPDVAIVGVDGGRLQIFDRPHKAEPPSAGADDAHPPQPVPTSESALGSMPPSPSEPESAFIDDDPVDGENNSRHWREDKIGLLMTVKSKVHAADPCPEIPEHFVDPLRIMKLARELKKRVPSDADAAVAGTDVSADRASDLGPRPDPTQAPQWEPPEVMSRRLVATRRVWKAFGPLVATRAWECGFFGAKRRAFLGDGASNNWTLWRDRFSSFTPILDFIHALSYVFAAATAGRSFSAGWACYVRWIGWVWQGRVSEVLVELEARQSELGVISESDVSGSPLCVVSGALEYLRNNVSRMTYAEYRRDGLPITSSYVESAVKQFNYRVKGTEKFWHEAGAEQMLQLRADFLSDDQPLDAFWEHRQANETGQRRYRKGA